MVPSLNVAAECPSTGAIACWRASPRSVDRRPARTQPVDILLRFGHVVRVMRFSEDALGRVGAILGDEDAGVLSLRPSVRLFVATQPVVC